MGFLKKQAFFVSQDLKIKHESLCKEVRNLNDLLKQCQNQIDELKINIWIYKEMLPKCDYRALHRMPGSPFSSYDTEVFELENQGWHIKRVSECGKYEIWVPGKVSDEKK